MAEVTLRAITTEAGRAAVACVHASREQQQLVATVEKSLAEVDADSSLTAFAIYDASQRGLPDPEQPAVGFAVSEVVASVGFVLRLLIDERHQGHGYGRAAMGELVRRLRLISDVEMVATSHRDDNAVMARLCEATGFIPWETPFSAPAGETYLRMPQH